MTSPTLTDWWKPWKCRQGGFDEGDAEDPDEKKATKFWYNKDDEAKKEDNWWHGYNEEAAPKDQTSWCAAEVGYNNEEASKAQTSWCAAEPGYNNEEAPQAQPSACASEVGYNNEEAPEAQPSACAAEVDDDANVEDWRGWSTWSAYNFDDYLATPHPYTTQRPRNEVDYSSLPAPSDPNNVYFANDPNWIWCPSTNRWSKTARKNAEWKPPHQ